LGATGIIGGKLDETKLDCMMNELGGQVWGLVAGFDTNKGHGETRDVVIIFKRQKN
jgi:hypothetical protein